MSVEAGHLTRTDLAEAKGLLQGRQHWCRVILSGCEPKCIMLLLQEQHRTCISGIAGVRNVHRCSIAWAHPPKLTGVGLFPLKPFVGKTTPDSLHLRCQTWNQPSKLIWNISKISKVKIDHKSTFRICWNYLIIHLCLTWPTIDRGQLYTFQNAQNPTKGSKDFRAPRDEICTPQFLLNHHW